MEKKMNSRLIYFGLLKKNKWIVILHVGFLHVFYSSFAYSHKSTHIECLMLCLSWYIILITSRSLKGCELNYFKVYDICLDNLKLDANSVHVTKITNQSKNCSCIFRWWIVAISYQHKHKEKLHKKPCTYFY